MSKYLSMLIKPSSGLCNASCKYCFYRDVSNGRISPMMSPEAAEKIIDRALCEADDDGSISFSFQGGEPTLSGIGFFEHFVSCARAAKKESQTLSFSIQTNGLTIDESWAGFFKKNSFLVGLSVDGDESVHDLLRGEGTHRRVMESYDVLKSAGIDVNLLTVVTKPLAKRAEKLYNFYLGCGADYVQVIPCLDPLDGSRQGWSLSPRMYSKFLIELCSAWYNGIKSGRTVRIRLFDNLLLMLNGYPPEQCGLDGRCRCQFVCESNGDVYPCDFYCTDEFKSGNVSDSSLSSLAGSAESFLLPQELPEICSGCKAKGICSGNCKRYRSFFFRDKNYCPMQDFIYTSYPKLYEIAHRYTRIG